MESSGILQSITLHPTLYSPDGPSAIHHRDIPSVPAAGSYSRYESLIQKSHDAGTRTSRRATSAAKATLNSSRSPLSPLAFFNLSPSISVAISAAHHSMAQLGQCQTKKKKKEIGGKGMKRGRMTSSIVLVASENQAPRHQRGASDLISIEPVTSSLGRFSPHGALTSSTVSQLSESQVCNNLLCFFFFFSSVLAGNDSRGWKRC